MAKSFLSLVLLSVFPLLGDQLDPWIPLPAEFHLIFDYERSDQDKFQTPVGSFDNNSAVNTFLTSLQVSPWPKYEIQLTLDCGSVEQSSNAQSFNLMAARGLIRYQWLDDACGDTLALVTGLYFETPYSHFIRNNNFFYIGNLDIGLSAAVGRSYYKADRDDWSSQIWGYLCYGFASQGSPWFAAIANYSLRITPNWVWSWLIRSRFGLGSQNVIPTAPFPGYGSINYQFVDVLAQLEYECSSLGTISGWVFYNLYARNTNEYYYGGGVELDIPFSF